MSKRAKSISFLFLLAFLAINGQEMQKFKRIPVLRSSIRANPEAVSKLATTSSKITCSAFCLASMNCKALFFDAQDCKGLDDFTLIKRATGKESSKWIENLWFKQIKTHQCFGEDGCCTPSNLCGENEGDCDTHDDCEPGLFCGVDNCQGPTFAETDDCCYKKTKICQGGGADGDCCTPSNLCSINEGDCDEDADCETGLVCGGDNCQGPTFVPGDDCCYKP